MNTKTMKADQPQSTTRDLIIVKATYTVKKEFVSENLENVRTFIDDLKAHQGIRYLLFWAMIARRLLIWHSVNLLKLKKDFFRWNHSRISKSNGMKILLTLRN